MTTSPAVVRRTHPWPSAPTRPPAPDESDTAPSITVKITMRGGDAVAAAAKLIEALRTVAPEIVVSAPQRQPHRLRWPSLNRLAHRQLIGAEFGDAETEPGLSDDLATADALAFAADLTPVYAAPDGAPPPLVIRHDQRIAELRGRVMTLTRREYDLLHYLVSHPRRVFSRPQLLRTVWGYEFDGGTRTIDVHIRRLRIKLGETGPQISTVRGVGYRFDDPELVNLLG